MGGRSSDEILDDEGADVLDGGAYMDRLFAWSGDDIYIGGKGRRG